MKKSIVNMTDIFTEAQGIITTDHSYIHEGIAFSVSGIFTSVANSATVNYAFKTPTVASGKYIHLKYKEIQASANKVRSDLYEAPTNAPTSGSDLAAVNRSRTGTPKTTNMQAVKSAMTIDLTEATTLETTQYVTQQARTLDLEFVLKPDTWYIRTFTNATGGATDISFFEFWYEESNG